MVAASELNINTGANATAMASEIFGDGVTVVSASYSGSGYSSGIYTGGDTTSPGVTPGDSGVILSTGRATDFTNSSGQANQDTNTSTNSGGQNNNSDFNAAAGARTYDASFLDVDFIPTGDTMTMQFVFSSDEFPEYANSNYQDFVGVWVNGTQATMAIGDANPGNLVGGINQNLYVDNTSDDYNTEMDGFTVTMTLTFPVIAGEVNSIRIGIADVGDSSYDSNLLIAGDSVQTVLIANDDILHLPGGETKTIDVLANDYDADGGTLTITHINNVAVSVGDTVTLATGQVVSLNADGTLTVVADTNGEYFNFTYTIDDGNNIDTGFVLVDSIPCFVAGTMIATPDGERRVEALKPGDFVITHDHGAQPVRWIGQRVVPAKAHFAPIRILANTFGTHGELLLSPQHRVLIRDALAELLFGETEVLVSAKDLVNDHSVRRVEGGEVEYVHILFDRHEVVYSEGLATESFLPGPQTTNSFERDIVDEICALFPEIDPETGEGYSPAARRTLRGFEAAVLMAQSAA
ncbi:Hint domain-containing protein [Aliiroseovarius subalbicans]|uniref:Hint domain-containing protein n=1 Tax=Aliiroseovarius subalbicans TaxID=2925840 RepID=UPI001F5AB8F8|nr:Hint domain-containing protein [Aliiroseovarius subalbicans]MCI2399877.1 Hint domain-containing protein [Aliiroseovarius subalbicans]